MARFIIDVDNDEVTWTASPGSTIREGACAAAALLKALRESLDPEDPRFEMAARAFDALDMPVIDKNARKAN